MWWSYFPRQDVGFDTAFRECDDGLDHAFVGIEVRRSDASDIVCPVEQGLELEVGSVDSLASDRIGVRWQGCD